MAEESVNIKTGWFGIQLTGPSALLMATLFAVAGNSALTLWEHFQRRQEHDHLECTIKLNLYIHTVSKEGGINWNTLPVDLYDCVPKFFYERPVVR